MSVQAGSYGYILSLASGLDLSTATAVNLIVKAPATPPRVIALTLPGDLIDGPSGKLAYQVQPGDFPVPGVYQLQVQDASFGRSVFSGVSTLSFEPNLS